MREEEGECEQIFISNQSFVIVLCSSQWSHLTVAAKGNCEMMRNVEMGNPLWWRFWNLTFRWHCVASGGIT
jgi:hypothetical protein